MQCVVCGSETSQNPCQVCGSAQPAAMPQQPVQPVQAVQYAPPQQQPQQQAWQQPAAPQPQYPQPVYTQPYAPAPQPPPQPYKAPAPYPPAPYAQPAYAGPPPVASVSASKRLHPSIKGAWVATIIALLCLALLLVTPYFSIKGVISGITDGFRSAAGSFSYGSLLSGDVNDIMGSVDSSFAQIGVFFDLLGQAGNTAVLYLIGLVLVIFPVIFLIVAACTPRSSPKASRTMFITGIIFTFLSGGLCFWAIYKIFDIIELGAPHNRAAYIALGGNALVILLSLLSVVLLSILAARSEAAHRRERGMA